MTAHQNDRNKVNLIHLPTGINIHELFKDIQNFPKKKWLVEQKLDAWFGGPNFKQPGILTNYNIRFELARILRALGYKNSLYNTDLHALLHTNHCIEEFAYIYIRN